MNLKRLISSGAGLIFKGSGFYINDYCRPKPASETNGTKDAKSATSLKSSENSTKKDGQTNNKNYNKKNNSI
jgi:predicted nucleic acid-binding Zn ribbon protein